MVVHIYVCKIIYCSDLGINNKYTFKISKNGITILHKDKKYGYNKNKII